ncbi:MAG: hypothetical protein SVG88_00870 [Halobacteriales archaeon]|nr:hypothetical protein [Halobacteriales archaeon]
MTLATRFKRLLGLGGQTTTETHQYECEVCHARFETAESETAVVACESCGSNDVRPV